MDYRIDATVDSQHAPRKEWAIAHNNFVQSRKTSASNQKSTIYLNLVLGHDSDF